ncbi:1-acyl-sn-glycerol-3-phosphate acyltransferase [Mangrovicoccus sp. HB182678]|uniref:1-acyl-sn-glycerol-3-phosphate acyltransferase n=2 Tax=Mangrovicoccus algicola TaxID=2771008 RepID=A0A8J7CW08_9RHOB|nr:lysophospholipid acyltransferase family protein [Mangrovicoccus algicola]MBE3637152.1 1-acyl-sn-glycerol-3-phosphate acyltransferase [Mangrovicoccus algicola]
MLRVPPIALVLTGGLGLLLALRLFERPLRRKDRPLSPRVTVAVCRIVLRLLGLRWQVEGPEDPAARLVVANHVSWLDIFVLNARGPVYFVAKSEVAGWPGIGLLARATGTVFIARDRRQAAAQAARLRDRLAAGHRLVLFPEGTSSDGRRVLRFRSAMFAALRDLPGLRVQPVTLAYRAPPGCDPRFHGWWGDMDLAPHLLQVLAAPRGGAVRIIRHPAIAAAAGRKALALDSEAAVRAGLEQALD